MLLTACNSMPLTNQTNVSSPDRVKVATFNVSMEARNYRSETDALSAEVLQQVLSDPEHPQIRNIAEVIQRVRPDILLLNEFDYIVPRQNGLTLFRDNFLAVSQNGQPPIDYPYTYIAPVNTGELMPLDTNGDGKITAPQDTYGFGFFPGHYGMAVLSQYPIVADRARRFRMFKWRDMPGALKPITGEGAAYYSPEVWSVFRLSSKSHWDIPIKVGDTTLHLLASHPTPPVFDGPEDRNGRRNHDEIRFWVDYISGEADYFYDDQGQSGGLEEGASFVIAGDLNASPVEGDSLPNAIQALLAHPRLHKVIPTSPGGAAAQPDNPHAASHTADWGLRADYVLPSSDLHLLESGVFWPTPDDPLAYLVENRKTSSDHRLVWVEIGLRLKGLTPELTDNKPPGPEVDTHR